MKADLTRSTSQAAQEPVPAPMPGRGGIDGLFRLYSNMVFRICLRYTKNKEDAEDMVSEVFIKVDKAFEEYRGDSKPMVWIYRIAVNHCLDYLRAKRSKNELDLEDLDTQGLKTLAGHDDQCLAKIALDRILGKINPTTRKILFLSYVEGLTHEEIAKTLGVTREAVTKKLARFTEEMKKKEKSWLEMSQKTSSNRLKGVQP